MTLTKIIKPSKVKERGLEGGERERDLTYRNGFGDEMYFI
jgi:hypothetical protein